MSIVRPATRNADGRRDVNKHAASARDRLLPAFDDHAQLELSSIDDVED